MPVPQADQISLEECIFPTMPCVFHFGSKLMVICTLPESYFVTDGKGITDMVIDRWHGSLAHSRPITLQTSLDTSW